MAARSINICEEHDNWECEHYCMDCKKDICLSCTLIGEHSRHDHCTIEQAVTQCRDVMKGTSTKMDEMIKSLDEGYEAMKSKMQEQSNYMRKKIDEHFNELEHYLKEQKEQVTQQLNDAISQALAATLAQAKNDVLSMKEVKDALEKKSDQDISSTNICTHKQVIDNCLQTLKSNYDKVNVEPDKVKSFPAKSIVPQFYRIPVGHISSSSELLIPAEIYINEIYTATLLTRNADGQYCSAGGNHVCMQLETGTGKITKLEVQDNCDGSYVASFTAEQVGASRLVVSINGSQTKGSPYSILVCRKYQAVKLPNKIVSINGSMGKPWGVAVGRYGVWTVADNSNHCFYVFYGEDQLVRKVGNRGSDIGEFVNPRGIVLDNENHIYVVDSGNHRVQKFDINGNYLLQFGGRGKDTGRLNTPYGITAHDDWVYVADYSNRRISVFQSNGQFCFCFGSYQLSSPYDVAVNANNELLVVDHNRDCVVIFTLDGNCKGKFGTVVVEGACSLTTDVNGFVLLGQWNFFHSIQSVNVFDHIGNHINQFGSQGDHYQFKSPIGIALSSNGNIYVSDHNNKRILIYTI